MTCAEFDDQGNVTITALFGIAIMSLLLAFAVYFAAVYVSWTNMNRALEVSKGTVMGTSFQMKLKSSQQPGRDLAEKIAASYRASGYQERLVVWFYESGWEGLGENVRALSVTAQSYLEVSSSVVEEPLCIIAETSAHLVPYSDTKVFKPTKSPSATKYEFSRGSSVATESQVPLAECPRSLSDETRKAEELAQTY